MTDDSESPPPTSQSPLAGLRRIGLTLAGLAVAWVIVAQVAPRVLLPHRQQAVAPVVPAPEQNPPPRSDEPDRIQALEARIKTLEDALAAAKTSPVSEERMTHIEEALTKQEEALQEMKTQIGHTQAADTHRIALVVALGQLREAVLSGKSFASQLDSFMQMASEDANVQNPIASLNPLAAEGVPTQASLVQDLDAEIPKALIHRNGNVIMRQLHSLIRIRKTGEPSGNDDEAVLARVEAKLGRGDVEGSLKETESLSPAAAEALASWKEKAQAFLTVRQALDHLQLAVVQDKPE